MCEVFKNGIELYSSMYCVGVIGAIDELDNIVKKDSGL